MTSIFHHTFDFSRSAIRFLRRSCLVCFWASLCALASCNRPAQQDQENSSLTKKTALSSSGSPDESTNHEESGSDNHPSNDPSNNPSDSLDSEDDTVGDSTSSTSNGESSSVDEGDGSSNESDGSGSESQESTEEGGSSESDSEESDDTGSSDASDSASTDTDDEDLDVIPDEFRDPAMFSYWGQNGYGGKHPNDPQQYELSLEDTCASSPEYDAVMLSFVISFFDPRNRDNLPALNFSFHCEEPFDQDNPFLLRCPQIEAGIKACHRLDKKVILSLGGASGSYGFKDNAQAKEFAQTVWQMFLGGSHAYRPFGNAILDGVDLDIEGGSSTGYAAFVSEMRKIMDSEGQGRTYYITAAPQCPTPDVYLHEAFEQHGDDFDYILVQFYNNYCMASGESFNFDEWAQMFQSDRPKIVVGLPATNEAGNGWVPPSQLPDVFNPILSQPAFGGAMLWDASFDQNSGQPNYREILMKIINR